MFTTISNPNPNPNPILEVRYFGECSSVILFFRLSLLEPMSNPFTRRKPICLCESETIIPDTSGHYIYGRNACNRVWVGNIYPFA